MFSPIHWLSQDMCTIAGGFGGYLGKPPCHISLEPPVQYLAVLFRVVNTSTSDIK